MEQASVNFFWAGLFSIAFASAAYVLSVTGGWLAYRRAATEAGEITIASQVSFAAPAGRAATGLTWVALAFLTASLSIRWIDTGNPPYTNMWEFTVAFSWGIVLSYVFFELWYGQRSLGVFVLTVPLILCLIAWAFFPSDVQRLVPALQSNQILGFHVGCMVLSYSALSVSFGASVMYLIQGVQRRFERLPSAELLEEIAHRSVLIGFPILTLGIALGAYWGNSAWGRYWGWDPKETAALATWLIYAGYMHMRGLRGWRGQRSALLLVVGFAAVLFNFFGVNLWVSGLHSYAGV